jgi:hypothetical protein
VVDFWEVIAIEKSPLRKSGIDSGGARRPSKLG